MTFPVWLSQQHPGIIGGEFQQVLDLRLDIPAPHQFLQFLSWMSDRFQNLHIYLVVLVELYSALGKVVRAPVVILAFVFLFLFSLLFSLLTRFLVFVRDLSIKVIHHFH